MWRVLPLRKNDVFLMEAISDSNLNHGQLEQMNACRMFLQVTTLAEVVDHTGTMLLPQILKQPKQDRPDGLAALSALTIHWPRVHQPSKASWTLWTRTLCNLITGTPNGRKLQQPLGAWTQDYLKVRFWKWRLSPHGTLLHQTQPDTPTRAAMPTKTQCTQLLFTLHVPTTQLFTGPPVTPHDTHNRIVPLPIPALPKPHETTCQTYHRTLTEQFRTTLEQWQLPLFGSIHHLQPNPAILDVSTAGETSQTEVAAIAPVLF